MVVKRADKRFANIARKNPTAFLGPYQTRDLAMLHNQTVVELYEPLIVSNHPAKSGGLLMVAEKDSACSLLTLKRMIEKHMAYHFQY